MNTPERFPNHLEIAGLALAFILFICNFTTTSTTTVNGRVVEQTKINYVALGLGPLTILAGLALLWMLRQIPQEDRLKHLGVMVVIIGLGGVNVARGIGAV